MKEITAAETMRNKAQQHNTNIVPFICFQFFYDASNKINTHTLNLKSHLKAIDVLAQHAMCTMFATIEMHPAEQG